MKAFKLILMKHKVFDHSFEGSGVVVDDLVHEEVW